MANLTRALRLDQTGHESGPRSPGTGSPSGGGPVASCNDLTPLAYPS